MKKVLKKFNRTLSIMLAAAMVLTMVPQTAMPVLAAENEVVEEASEASEGTDVTPADEDNESTDVKDADDTDISGDSEITEGETEGSEDDSETPVINDGDVSDDDQAEEEEPDVQEEPVEEETEPTESDDQDVSDDEPDAETNAETNAVADSDTTITEVIKEGDNEAAGTAQIVYLGGCVSDGKLAKGRELKFRVEPADGHALVSVTVNKVDGETESAVSSSPSDGVYTIAADTFTKGSGEAKEDINGKITVTTKKVNYKVSFAADEFGMSDAYDVYAVETVDNAEVLGSVVAAAVDIEYGESKNFAVVLKTPDETKTKLEGITLGGKPVEFTEKELNKKGEAAGTAKTECFAFTVDPSTAESLKGTTTDGTAAEVYVKAVALASLAVMFEDDSLVKASTKNTAAANFINYEEGAFDEDSVFLEDEKENLKKSLAFKVVPEENHKVASVTAVAIADEDWDEEGTEVTVAQDDPSAADGSVECTIALNQDALKFSENTTVIISIATELDTTKPAVHTISFKNTAGNAPANVTIRHGAVGADTELEAGETSLKVTDNTYQIKVTPDAGYELAKGTTATGEGKNDDKFVVKIKESRKYAAVAADTENNKPALPEATKDVTTEVEAYADGTAKVLTLNFTGNDKYADTEDARDYTVSSVEVTIDTNAQKNDGEKIVRFIDYLNEDDETPSYEIVTEGILHDDEANDVENTWVVPASVDELVFKVTSEKEPYAHIRRGNTYMGTAEGNVYTYTIPAMALNSDGVTEIEIDSDVYSEEKTVRVKAVADDVNVKRVHKDWEGEGEWEENFNLDPDWLEDGYYTLYDCYVVEGDKLNLTFVPKPGAAIEKVAYEMGEDKGDAAPDRKGNVTLSLTVTDDIKIDVVSKNDYRVMLTCGTDENGDPKELAQDGDAYVADYTDTNINIGLTKSGVPYREDLYNVVVKDGAKTAETEAKVNRATATIEKFAEAEYGTALTIEVYTDKDTKYTTTLKTNAVSSAVTVTREADGKVVAEDATVEIMPDAKLAFNVTPANGASLSDLEAEILAKDGTALAAASTPIESSDFTDGVLTIQTKPTAAKDTEVLVSIYNANAKKDNQPDKTSLKGGKFVLKLTDPLVNSAEISKVNAVAGSGTNRAVKLNVSVDFKNKKSLPTRPVLGKLYYKVEFAKPEGAPADATVAPATTQYVLIDDYANTAKTVEFTLVTEMKGDTDGQLKDIAETISTTAKVTLVQSLSTKDLTIGTVADTDYVAGPEAAMKDNTLSTKAPVYETKLSVKNVNGAAVFTGQGDAKVATPVFGKTTGYDEVSVQFVDTKTGVLKSERGRYTTLYDDNWGEVGYAWVDADNSIHVGINARTEYGPVIAKEVGTNLGVKVTAMAPDESYAASAIVKLKVQQGIFNVEVDESKAKLPNTIFKDAKTKKAASVKITAKLNWGNKNYKPAKSAVVWSIDTAYGNDSAYAKAALSGNKPLVSVKNGTVSIAKDYVVQPNEADNKFTVTIKANDFAGNETYTTKDFEVTDEKNEIGKLVVLDNDGNVKDPAALTAEDFDYWNHDEDNGSDDYTKHLYVAAIKKDAPDAKWYGGDDILPVTFKSSNAKALAVNTADGLLTFSKPADRIKITATTVDGGKAKKAELVVNVKPYKQVGLMITDIEDHYTGLGQTEIHYSGGNNERYYLYPHYAVGNGWNGISDYKNLKITVKGGKFIANKNWAKNRGNYMGYAVVVTDKSGTATVTITDTANKDKTTNHKDYKITNDSFTATKAPSIKLYDPKKVTVDTEAITWQVTDKNNDNYAGKYVKLTPDFTVTASNPAWDIVEASGTIKKIDENGRFTLDTYIYYGGAYKMVATVGTMVGGEFVAAAKDVKLSFSIPVKKLKTTLTVKGNYTLDAKSASAAKIDVKSDYAYDVSSAMNVIKKTQGKDDHTNKFTKYFEVRQDWDDNYTIGLKSGLSAEDLAYITSKDGKEDCTGYITVTNYDDEGNELNTKDVQVKISFKTNKYSLTGATIFSNGTATTPVTATVKLMNGKVHDYVAVAAVADGGNFAAATNAISFNEEGDIVITSNAASIAPGKYNVKLLVVPQSSSFVKWDAATGKWINASDKENGTALTDDQLFAAAGIPVTAKIDVKAVDTKKIAKAKSLNVTLSTKAYDEENGNGYVQNEANGYYQVDVPYSIAIGGSDISSETGKAMKVNLTNKAGTDQNKVNGEDLVKVEKASDWDGNPVIRLQVSKKALVALTDTPKAQKPITGYGKKLKVPVVVQYTNGVTTTDTLTFNITMPKNKPADFATVQKNVTDNKAAIEKIKTRLGGNANRILTTLTDQVEEKVRSLIPADTDVEVGEAELEGAPTPNYDKIMSDGSAKVTLTLTDVSKTTDNTADMSWTYDLDMNIQQDDVRTLIDIIESLDLTYSNTTTKESLLEEIKADDDVAPYLVERKGHLSIKVTNFYLNPATTNYSGRIWADIEVKDLMGGSRSASVRGEIARLMTLKEAKTAVRELIDEDVEVLKFYNDNFWDETNTKNAVIAAAENAIWNNNIKVSIAAWDYVEPVQPKQPDENGSEGKDGSLQFTVRLTKTQADGERIADIRSAKATVSKEDDRRRQELLKFIDTYLGKSAEMDGISSTEFDSTKNEFTVTINTDAARTNVRDDFEAWVKKMDADDKLKADIRKQVKEAFEDDWNSLKSVTLDANVTALKENESKKTTLVKETDETIDEFADRIYAKLKENQKYYLDKLEKKVLDRVGEDEDLNYAFLIAANPSGILKVTVDWNDGTQSSQSCTVKVK